MKCSYDECIELYKFYSIKLANAIILHNINLINHYTNKIHCLVEYAIYEYDLDLHDIDLTDVLKEV